MSTFKEVLLQSCDFYTTLQDKVKAAVDSAENGNFQAVASIVDEFMDVLAEIKKIDRKLYTLSNATLIKENIGLWNKRMQLIETNSDYHKKHLPHLQSIMAIQQADLKSVKSGIRGVNGYLSGTNHTGSLISEST